MKLHTILRDSLLLTVLMLAYACTANADSKKANEDNVELQCDSTKHITFLFAGDLMQHGTQYQAALRAGGGKSYNYDEVFRYVKEDISSVDVAVANFETTLAGPPYSTYPQFCSPDSYFKAAVDAGFDVMLTANNHSVDKRAKGIVRTIAVMDSAKIAHLGTYEDQAARDAKYPYILEKNGFRIALLVYTYDTNGIPVPSPCIVNTIDTIQIRKDIEKAKRQNVDCTIAFMHWGIEHALLPSQKQKELADWLFENGVDHIIGGHPHVVEPIEVRVDSKGQKHLLVYSLGNFVSNMTKPNNDGGLMVKMELEKDSITRMVDCSYSITWVSRPQVSGHTNYRIYPVSVPMNMLNAAEKTRFNTTLKAERELFKKHNKGIEEYQAKCSNWEK